MFNFGNKRLIKEVAVGMHNLLGLLDVAGVGQPPMFWRDPYALGFLFGAGSMLTRIGSRGQLRGEKAGEVITKAFQDLAGLRGPQVVSTVLALSAANNKDFADAARLAVQLVSYTFAGRPEDNDFEIFAAMPQEAGLSAEEFKSQTHHTFVQRHWIDAIRERL